MNRYQIARLAAALAAVAAGLCYLTLGVRTLVIVLPVMCVCFWTIAVLSYREGKDAGLKGVIALLPALAALLAAGFATVGMVIWLVQR